MPLVRTNGVSTIVARAQTLDNQRPWLERCATYWSDVYTQRKIQTWKGLDTARSILKAQHLLVSGRYCVAIVMALSKSNGYP